MASTHYDITHRLLQILTYLFCHLFKTVLQSFVRRIWLVTITLDQWKGIGKRNYSVLQFTLNFIFHLTVLLKLNYSLCPRPLNVTFILGLYIYTKTKLNDWIIETYWMPERSSGRWSNVFFYCSNVFCIFLHIFSFIRKKKLIFLILHGHL